ncbi:cGMP-dependent protein kinase [Pleodorina starrii]|nr:cGMP-dependent protein kinase [Pleodorina starrii]
MVHGHQRWSVSGGSSKNGSLPKLWGKKRQAVAAESSVVTGKVPIVPKPEKTKELIAKAIADNLLFQDLPRAALEVIIDSMHSMEVAAGTDIIRQGDRDASQFFVLEAGVCEVWVRSANATASKKVHVYSAGSAFGELALLYSAPRAATVKGTTRCVLWVMERSVYNAVKRNFTHEQLAARHNLLDTVPALKNLSNHQKALLVDALTQAGVEFKPGKHVFKRGDPGSDFFIVKEGTALVKDAGGNVLSRLTVGQYFGEKALLEKELRAADVVADGKLICYCLSAAAFQELLGSKEEIWRFEHLKEVPILSALSERQLWQMAHAMKASAFKKGEVVFRKGEAGDTFFIVQSGSFVVLDDGNKELARVGEGGCFGELALLRSDVRAATVKAVADSSVLTLSRDEFTRLLGNLSQLRSVWRLEALKKVPLLTALDAATRSSLAAALRSVNFSSSEDVIRQGDIGDRFYIVERGELGVFKDRQGPIKTYAAGAYFGELALLRNEPRAATVRANTDVSLLELDRGHFHELLGPLLPVMTREAEAYLRQGANWKPQSKVFNVSDAQAVAVLGAGGFGQVLLVQYKGNYRALKIISKGFVKEQGLVEHVKREKELMSECDSHFLVKLEGTTTDDTMLYMMMEAVMGGELFSYLQTRTRPLDENHARFYAASVILALEYLHDRDMVYRDLKPENLLIDLQGYVKVTDFGFVKRLKRGTKTYTLCGTPEYLAPEIIMNKGHNGAADWWALGVLIFELCNGLPPFMDDDRLVMFRKICNRELTFPKHITGDLKHLIERLLDPNPLFRAGAGREGAAEIKSHAWFAGFDWDKFAAKQLPAPYIPKQPSHAGDTCNFAPMQVDTKQFRNKAYKSKGVFKDF